MKKILLLALVLVLLSTAVVVGFVRPVVAEETIYIKSDGSVEGTDKIQRNGNVYTLTSNIYSAAHGIRIEKDNVMLDGAGYTVQGPGEYCGIVIFFRHNVTISDIEIRAFSTGVYVESSSKISICRSRIIENQLKGVEFMGVADYQRLNNVIGNYIANSSYGIDIATGSSYTVAGNNVTNNWFGIRFSAESSNSSIYHNNLMNNTWQVYTPYWAYNYTNFWDNGYPSGGNYWSNHTGVDLFSGPYQNETGSDGIADTPYTIDANNTDRFPLMGPISFFNACTWDEKTYYVHTVSNSTVSDFYFSEDDKLVSFNVTGTDDMVGFCRVTIPNELLWCDTSEQWTVLVNKTAVPYTVIENGDHTYLYFNYSHSIQNVQIEGIHVIPEFPTWTSMLLTLIILTVVTGIYRRRPFKTPKH